MAPPAASTSRALSRRELLSLDALRPSADHWIRVFRRAMACRFEVTLSGEDARHVAAAREALDAVDRIEDALSHFRDTSELSRLNGSAADRPFLASPGLMGLLGLCRRLHEDTGGAFDVTATPLSRVWGFLERKGRVPPPDELESARACVGLDKVVLDETEGCVRFSRPGVELGFGSIGKGWALDKVAELLGRRGVSRALLSAGGSSFRAIGGRHEGFLVEVRPDRGAALARLRVRDGALGVSGSGEQFFEADGRTYGHVIDPRSGRPVEGTRAAAVVAREAAVADALATAFFVGGPKLAERYCAAHPGTLAMLALPGEGEPRVFGESPAADLVEAA